MGRAFLTLCTPHDRHPGPWLGFVDAWFVEYKGPKRLIDHTLPWMVMQGIVGMTLSPRRLGLSLHEAGGQRLPAGGHGRQG